VAGRRDPRVSRALDLARARGGATFVPMREGEIHRAAASGKTSGRRRRRQALRQSPPVFRELMELAPDAVVVGDADHRITDVNPAACSLYGYSAKSSSA